MSDQLRAVERFLYDEADLLDARRFRDWLALFLPDAFYWAPSHPEQTSRRGELSLIDEGVAGMELRINRLAEPSAHTEHPPRRTCRMLSNIVIEAEEPDALVVRAKFVLHDYRVSEFGRDEARLFAGTQRHRLARDGDGFRIAWKRVDLISADAAMPVLSPPF